MPVLKPDDLLRVPSVSTDGSQTYADHVDLSGPGGLSALRAQIEVLAPGASSSAPHAHSHRDELVLVIAGHPLLTLGDTDTRLSPGQVVALPAGGELHQITNPTTEEVQLLVVANEPGNDTVRYE